MSLSTGLETSTAQATMWPSEGTVNGLSTPPAETWKAVTVPVARQSFGHAGLGVFRVLPSSVAATPEAFGAVSPSTTQRAARRTARSSATPARLG